MSDKTILPVCHLIDLLEESTNRLLAFHGLATMDVIVYEDIVHTMVDESLNTNMCWCENKNLLERKLAEVFNWYTEGDPFTVHYFQSYVDHLDCHVKELVNTYVPHNTWDMWGLEFLSGDVVIVNYGDYRIHRYYELIAETPDVKLNGVTTASSDVVTNAPENTYRAPQITDGTIKRISTIPSNEEYRELQKYAYKAIGTVIQSREIQESKEVVKAIIDKEIAEQEDLRRHLVKVNTSMDSSIVPRVNIRVNPVKTLGTFTITARKREGNI